MAHVEDPQSSLPESARIILKLLVDTFAALEAQITELDAKIHQRSKVDPTARRLMTIPGVGPIASTAITALVPSAAGFRTGRDFAAWLGLTPLQKSTGGKQKLGAISKRGKRTIRRLLILWRKCRGSLGQPARGAHGLAQCGQGRPSAARHPAGLASSPSPAAIKMLTISTDCALSGAQAGLREATRYQPERAAQERRSQQPRRFRRPTRLPAPRRPAGLPSLTPQDRCRRLRLDAEGAALVDVGAVGGEAPDEMLGGKYGCHLAATLTRRSAMKVRHGVMGWTPPDGICVPR